uniref:Uncharacterized protein n=1 Tax=Anguilla anguilla TaxID=7936 RepID=A0A0E9ULJ2_ANGAN
MTVHFVKAVQMILKYFY